MEIIEIKSAHSLNTNAVTSRPIEKHSYRMNCRQYVALYQDWQRNNQTPDPLQAMSVMTLDYVQIWLTGQESKQIADAIQAARSPVIFE